MIKNIIIGALAIGLLFMSVFANVKAVEAEENAMMSQQQEQEAIKQAALARMAEAEAVRQMERAELALDDVREQQRLAESAREEAMRLSKALADCKNGK